MKTLSYRLKCNVTEAYNYDNYRAVALSQQHFLRIFNVSLDLHRYNQSINASLCK